MVLDLNRRPNSYDHDDDDDELCCCEYISDITGQRSHLLAFCCDCEAVDDTFDSLITGRNPTQSSKIWPIIKDRMRIPWFDGSGAKRLIFLDEPITTVPFLIVPCFAFLATIGPISTLISFITLFILLFAFRKKLRGSKFYFAFLIAGSLYAFLVFQLEVVPTIDLKNYVGNLTLLILILITIYVTRKVHFKSQINYSTNLSSRVHQLPSYCYCRTCETFVEGRDHHCVWLGCCIGQKNRRWFLATLTLFSLWLIWTIVLFTQSIYSDDKIGGGEHAETSAAASTVLLLPKTGKHNAESEKISSAIAAEQRSSVFSYFYHDFHSSIRAITLVFGCVILFLVLAILIHQYRMMIKGMSYLEWKHMQKMKKTTTSTSTSLSNQQQNLGLSSSSSTTASAGSTTSTNND